MNVCSAKRKGQRLTLYDTVERVQTAFEQNPRKSIRITSRELQLHTAAWQQFQQLDITSKKDDCT